MKVVNTNKRYYDKSIWRGLMITEPIYLEYHQLREGDVYLADSSNGTRVISKIIEIDIEEATIVDVGGDMFRVGLGSLQENEYLRCLDNLKAIKILFNHNENGSSEDCESIVSSYFSEYLI